MREQAVAATVKLSRDPHIPTKLAAAQATGSLLKAELDGHLPEGCAMEPLVPVLVALLGRDQNSEVQRQGLQVCRGPALRHACHLLQAGHHAITPPVNQICQPSDPCSAGSTEDHLGTCRPTSSASCTAIAA